MKVTLPKEVIDGLPSPDSEGLVRVNAAIRLGTDGQAEVVEINDQPVPVGDEADDENPMPSQDVPDLSKVEESFY